MTVRCPFPERLAIAVAIAVSAGTAMAQSPRLAENVGAQNADAPGSNEQEAGGSTSRVTEADARVEQARQAFVLGATLAAQQQWADALNAFERSSKLRSHPVTTYNLAYCERALGHYTRSYKLFRASLSEHEAASNGVLPEDLLALAKAYVPGLERKVARAHVRMQPGLAGVSVDGRPLEMTTPDGTSPVFLTAGTRDTMGSEEPPAATFDLMIDPGRHVFVISRKGEPDRVLVAVFEEGATRDLVLDTSPRERPPPASPSGPDRETVRSNVPVYIAYGVGGAGLIVGSIFGIAAIRAKGYLDEHCSSPSTCDSRYRGDIDALSRDALIADIGFGVALVGAGVGTYFLLTGRTNERSNRNASSPKIEARIGARGIAARGEF